MDILIVEDELIHAYEMAGWLEKNGYNVLEVAKSAKKALEIIQKTPPNLMVVDIGLNGDVDGIQLMKMVQEERHIPFLYLTNKHLEYDRAKTTNPDSFLTKSELTRASLLRSVDLALHRFMQRTENTSKPKKTVTDGIFVLDNKSNLYQKILTTDICWLQADGVCTNIEVVDGQRHVLTCNLSTFMGQIQSNENIIRINQKYAININNVTAYKGRTVYVSNKKIEKPISDIYCPDFDSRFTRITTNRSGG